MNYIGYMCNKGINFSPREVIQAKEDFYHINDSLKINKLAFAYFLDQYTVKASDEKGVKEVKALSKYEWFSGSLTAEQFAKELRGFIASPQSSALKPELKQNIEEFASTLEKSNKQGYLIDLIRSKDLKLIFLILTGIVIGEAKIEVKDEEIQGITSETLKQIKSLKEGEKRIFLVGSLLHETRLTVERKKTGWEVCYFDSVGPKFVTYQCMNADPLLTPEFWDKIYSLKFSSETTWTKEKDQAPTMVVALEELKTHISTVGKEIKNEHSPEVFIRDQKRNTCHFKGLLAELKKEIICSQSPHCMEAVTDWKEFKLAFGNYLLEDKKIDIRIKKQALEQQDHRKARAHLIALFASMSNQGNYDETVKSYVEAIKKVCPGVDVPIGKDSKLQELKSLDFWLMKYLNRYLVFPEDMQSLLGTIENPCVANAVSRSEDLFASKQQKFEKELNEQLKIASSTFDGLIESAQEKFNEATNKLFGTKEEDHWNSNCKLFDYMPIEEKKIEHYLTLFSNRPELLIHLHQRPALISILMQSIQLGKMESIKQLYDGLSANDKNIFEQALKFCREEDGSGSRICAQLLPKAVLEFYFSNPNHPISEILGPLLINQAISE